MRYENAVVALGMFDGVHLGHRALLEETRKVAQRLEAKAYAFCFFNHPGTIFGETPELLTTAAERQRIIKSLGVEPVMIPFTKELSEKTPEMFLAYLKTLFDIKALVSGFDYRFGHKASGNDDYLKIWTNQEYIHLSVIDPVLYQGEKVSSTRIRKCLKEGLLEDANAMLVDSYSLFSRVKPHSQIGRRLGFPTANVLPGEKVIPRHGVYITSFKVDAKTFPAVTNIGVRPTVENAGEVIIETHVLGECGDLYGKDAEVILRKFLRDEKKFETAEKLQKQVSQDCQLALQFHMFDKEKI